MAAMLPLPLLPAMCTVFRPRWGLDRRAKSEWTRRRSKLAAAKAWAAVRSQLVKLERQSIAWR